MDTLKSMVVFRTIVEQGSFTKTAKQLNMSVAMTSKHLKHLENFVQAKLLNRSNRQQSLTEIGQRYYQECCYALDTLDNARSEAQQHNVEPKGTLKIAAPIWFSVPYFANILADFSHHYPKITLTLNLDNRHTDLIAAGYDVALRVTNKPQDNLIVKPLSVIHFYYVASPDYLTTKGYPKDFDALNQYHGILPNYVGVDTPLNLTHDSNNTVMLLEMAKAGMGVAILPEWLIIDSVQSGELVRLFESKNKPTLYAAYMNRDFLSIKVRCLIDFLTARLNPTSSSKMLTH